MRMTLADSVTEIFSTFYKVLLLKHWSISQFKHNNINIYVCGDESLHTLLLRIYGSEQKKVNVS